MDALGRRIRKNPRPNTAARIAANKRWIAKNKEKVSAMNRNNRLKRKYGIGIVEYDAVWKKQEGRCAICGTDKPGGAKRLYIDHEHKSGRIRGLLCVNCNLVLGCAKESTKILLAAFNYLHYYRLRLREQGVL